ncbi:MAG: hypothetical protein H0S85_12245 [Desulfovibrionaceae bacterium]|jgi:hypothetical protein|nr:hypothetical protein [Desulfovibrionaceae bacterium]
MKRLLVIAAVSVALWCTPLAALAGALPDTAALLAQDLDGQLVQRFHLQEGPAKGYGLIVTTPVSLDDLEVSSPLARQLGEELATWFVRSGYKVQEIRKGRNVLIAPKKGEMLLTRRTKLLDSDNVRSSLILTGTYLTTTKNVRFSVRIMDAGSNEVLAMSSVTLPVTSEVYEVLSDGGPRSVSGLRPTVATRVLR